MAKNKLLVMDTETGGLDPNLQSILSFGAVVLEGGKIIDAMEVFIAEPEIIAQDEALFINKIDLDWLRANGLPPFEAAGKIVAFLSKHFGRSKAMIAGQNIGFDQGFVKRLFRLAYGAEWQVVWEKKFSHRSHDTMHVLRFLGAAGILPFVGGDLEQAVEFLGIDTSGLKRHNAKDDATITAMVLLGLTHYMQDMYDRAYPVEIYNG